MKILITGVSDLYGSKLTEITQSRGSVVYPFDIQDISGTTVFVLIDVSNKDQVKNAFQTYNPNVVVQAESLTDVDKCELNIELACKVNVEGTKTSLKQPKPTAPLYLRIYILRFWWEKVKYKETDQLNPIN